MYVLPACSRITHRNKMSVGDLQEIPSQELTEFMKRMKNNFPKSIHAHGFIRTLINWKDKLNDPDIFILAPNGDPSYGIVFYFLLKNAFIGSVYAHDEEAVNSLQVALQFTKKLPYLEKKMAQLTCLNDLALKSVNSLTLSPEWQIGQETRNGHRTLWLPWIKAREIKVDVPDGVEIRDLTKEHARQINDNWTYNFQGSEELIKMMIELNFGLGVFRGESLLSWALLWYYGGIGSVETLEKERGKGYGRAVVSAIVKKMGEKEMDAHLNVVVGNEKAESFFKSLGFSFGCSSMWITRHSPSDTYS